MTRCASLDLMAREECPDAPSGTMPSAPQVEFTAELQQEVLDLIAGGQSLREICRKEGMPEITQVMRLRRKSSEFEQQYAHAREMQAEVFGEELKEIVDDGRNDWMEINGKDGESVGWRINGEAVQRSRLRFDQRRWWMSKVLPKSFGDKLTQEHTGPDGAGIQFVLTRAASKEK